ncbi:hypothetical protein TWF281_004981 [Arthrobotrys megalospora]
MAVVGIVNGEVDGCRCDVTGERGKPNAKKHEEHERRQYKRCNGDTAAASTVISDVGIERSVFSAIEEVRIYLIVVTGNVISRVDEFELEIRKERLANDNERMDRQTVDGSRQEREKEEKKEGRVKAMGWMGTGFD